MDFNIVAPPDLQSTRATDIYTYVAPLISVLMALDQFVLISMTAVKSEQKNNARENNCDFVRKIK